MKKLGLTAVPSGPSVAQFTASLAPRAAELVTSAVAAYAGDSARTAMPNMVRKVTGLIA